MVNIKDIDRFFDQYCSSSEPLLLALSGGPDSLFLFFYLLRFRERSNVPFYVAHVDHGWREESRLEAEALRQLADSHEVSFFLKTLDPTTLKGNLESACREERYAFFAALSTQHHCQCVVTGHHRDDRAETILKQLFEGAHWSSWSTLKAKSLLYGVQVLRPLMNFSKSEIEKMVCAFPFSPFIDKTNQDCRHLRARMRQTIFPWLNEMFGKEVQNNLIELANESEELSTFFHERLKGVLDKQVVGPWGIYLDLRNSLPTVLVEIKYLLRLFCKQHGFYLSRQSFTTAAIALQEGKPLQKFMLGNRMIAIDRKSLFLLEEFSDEESCSIALKEGSQQLGSWNVETVEVDVSETKQIGTWREGWTGRLVCFLPHGNYQLEVGQLSPALNLVKVKKEWNQAKVPSFLYPRFPLVKKDGEICHEFLSGQGNHFLRAGEKCLMIKLAFKGPIRDRGPKERDKRQQGPKGPKKSPL
jgi:tRNA(Ile)-lysidine synthase